MATTSSNLTAGAAIVGQGGNGNGKQGRAAGLVATVAVGLGLLTGVVLGRAHQAAAPAGDQEALPHALVVPAGYQANYRFLEQNTQFPASDVAPARSAAQQRFLEQNLDLPVVGTASPSGSDRQRFLEWNTQFPTGGAPAQFVPDTFTYREDHRASTTGAFVPDQFTYREDHRASTAALVTPDPSPYREDHRGER
jgi:hypothetical protein